MKSIRKIFNISLVLFVLLFSSCGDITDINENPNGVGPNTAHPSLLLSTVMSSTGKVIIQDGYANVLATNMQHTQKDSWSDNNYEELGGGNWDAYFAILRNANLAYNRSVDLNSEFYKGVSMVMKAQIFGLLTDFYGDVPYSEALKGGESGEDAIIKPAYDSQESVYKSIISDMLAASVLLSKDATSYSDINPSQDLYFNGDPDKWMRFANSLALRYYMRLSEKDPNFAGEGVKDMLGKPLITSNDQGCSLQFIGVTGDDSWPNNGVNTSRSDFTRIKPCTTLTNKLKELDDPRIHEWFAPVERPIKVVPSSEMPGIGDDIIVDGIRYIKQESMAPNNQKVYDPATWYQDRRDKITMVDSSPEYVGLPPSNQDTDPFAYNLNPQPERGGWNVHVSEMNAQFNETSGDNLKARILSAAEVHFLMAEAAVRGWGSDAETHYNMGIEASLEDWGIGNKYDDYIDNAGVAFDGSLEQVMEQKWISAFAAANEAYFDWRRTGLPNIQTGPYAKSSVIPVRSTYADSDKNINHENYLKAVQNLEVTEHTDDVPGNDGADSDWSKNWAQQGVVKPWN